MRRWRGVAAVEGVVTEDGRLIEPTAIEWSDDPIPLMSSRSDGTGDWSCPMLGYIETLERREREPYGALIVAEGVLFDTATLPDSLDLSAFVVSGGHDIAGEGVDHPLALVRCVLKQVVVGNPKVWDECVLEVLDEPEA